MCSANKCLTRCSAISSMSPGAFWWVSYSTSFVHVLLMAMCIYTCLCMHVHLEHAKLENTAVFERNLKWFITIMLNACIQPDPGNSGGAADSQQPDLAEFVSSVCWRKVWPHTPLMHTPCHGTHLLHMQNTRTILAANSQGHIKVNSCTSYHVGCQPMNTSLYCRCWRWPLRLEPPAMTVCSIYIVLYILTFLFFVEFYCQKVSITACACAALQRHHVRLGTRFSLLFHTASNG